MEYSCSTYSSRGLILLCGGVKKGGVNMKYIGNFMVIAIVVFLSLNMKVLEAKAEEPVFKVDASSYTETIPRGNGSLDIDINKKEIIRTEYSLTSFESTLDKVDLQVTLDKNLFHFAEEPTIEVETLAYPQTTKIEYTTDGINYQQTKPALKDLVGFRVSCNGVDPDLAGKTLMVKWGIMPNADFSDTQLNKDITPYNASYSQSTFKLPDGPVYLVRGEDSETIFDHPALHMNFFKEASPVRVKYENTNGTEIAKNDLISGRVGDNYQTSKKNIPDWDFIRVTGAEQGVLSSETQEVTYVYQQIKGAPVTVNYQDVNGKTLAKPTVLNGAINSTYKTSPAKIANWHVKEIRNNETGIFKSTAQQVTYIYEKNKAAPVTVNYVDNNGNILAPPVKKNGLVGDSYKMEAAQIAGWHVKNIVGNESGEYTTDPQTVSYIYEENNTDKKKDNDQGMDKKDPLQETLPNTGDSSTDGLFGILLGLMIITTEVLYLFKYNPK